MERAQAMWIDGAPVAGARTMPVINPADAQAFALAPDCTAAELDHAVSAARRALAGWSATPVTERQKPVAAFADVIMANLEELKALFTREQGKPLYAAEIELQGASFWCQGMATLAPETKVLEDTEERLIEVRRVPVGVVAGIVPWNFPVLLALQKIAPALIAGCTIVIKTSPFTPLTLLRIIELMGDRLPPGVVNVICGGDDLGPMLTEHKGIDKISFTGSTETGKAVMKVAADDMKRLTMELGGNDAGIVLADVDIAEVAPKLFWGAFVNSAQLCLAIKRLYIPEEIFEPLTEAILEYARKTKVGDGAQEGSVLGPIQNERQYEKVRALIEQARRDGLKFRFEGEAPQSPGYFVPITIIENPPEDHPVVTDEAFGPVLPILTYKSVDEVVDRANASIFGLGASVWGKDVAAAQAVAERIDAGVVWVNEIHHLTPFTPLGGRKQSGFGVENGIEGLHEFTALKTMVVRRNGAAVHGA